MKRVILICLSLLLSHTYLSAQEKVVESSAKRAPEWIGTTESGYIITSAESATLEEARRTCLANIQQSIITGVAVNISSVETLYDSQYVDGDNYYVSSSYESRVKAVATKLPYLQGITLDDADIYWKKIFDKADKSHKYEVHVKYPFSAQQRNAIVSEFKRIEKEHNDKLQEITEAFSTFTEVEYIAQAMNDLDALNTYYFDEVRQSEVLALKENYRRLYSAISITPYYSSLGEILYSLNLNGRRVTTARRPVIKSEYATEIEYSATEDNLYRITYNYEYCQPEDDNKIEVTYQFGGSAIARYTFYIDLSADHIEVIPFGEIEVDVKMVVDETTGKQTTHLKGFMNLRAKQDTKFRITGINILFNNISLRVNTTLDTAFEGKGNHRLCFEADSAIESMNRKDGIASGTITLLNAETNKSEDIRFSLPYRVIL
ncbi:MAG: hypothetical protein J6V55_04010 [Alistipes sp.]|nr:hypothetical protein [Alistipes sp.]